MPNLIENYTVIGNCQSIALVGRCGSIDWLGLPRVDSAACFAALLGSPEHGRWLIAPAEATTLEIVGNPADDEIKLGGEQIARQDIARIDLDVQFELGGSFADFTDSKHRQIDGGRRDGADRDNARAPCPEIGKFLFGLRQLQQDGPGVARQSLAKRINWTPRDRRSHSLASRRASISAIMREAAGWDMFADCAAALTIS